MFMLPTPTAEVSSLVMVSSVISFDEDEPSTVNLHSSERLDRARDTFKGFLNVTSTMIGSVKTKKIAYRVGTIY